MSKGGVRPNLTPPTWAEWKSRGIENLCFRRLNVLSSVVEHLTGQGLGLRAIGVIGDGSCLPVPTGLYCFAVRTISLFSALVIEIIRFCRNIESWFVSICINLRIVTVVCGVMAIHFFSKKLVMSSENPLSCNF